MEDLWGLKFVGTYVYHLYMLSDKTGQCYSVQWNKLLERRLSNNENTCTRVYLSLPLTLSPSPQYFLINFCMPWTKGPILPFLYKYCYLPTYNELAQPSTQCNRQFNTIFYMLCLMMYVIIISVLQMRKLRLREFKWFIQGHTIRSKIGIWTWIFFTPECDF